MTRVGGTVGGEHPGVARIPWTTAWRRVRVDFMKIRGWAFLASLFIIVCFETLGHAQEGRPRREGFSPFGPSESVDWAERRKTLTATFDADKDGRLSPAEREAMRLARSKEARSGRGRGGFRFMPPEILKKYDKDGDGTLNEEEGQAAQMGIRKQVEEITRDYDKNKNGRLDEAEMESVRKDIDAGKITGVPRFFFMGGGRGGRGGRESAESPFKAADKDGDGKLSAEELRQARELKANKENGR